MTALVRRSNSTFEAIEKAGTECCVDCRDCTKCKESEEVEQLTIRDEVEQDLIEKCVEVDIDKNHSLAELPFMGDPTLRLPPTNRRSSLKIYKSVVKGNNRNPNDKKDSCL